MKQSYFELEQINELLTNQHDQLQQEVKELRKESEKIKGENEVLLMNIGNAKKALDLGIEKEDTQNPFD